MKYRKLRYDQKVIESKYEKFTSWNIAIGSFITTVIVWAYYTNDPVNTPKLATLALTSFFSTGLLVNQLTLTKKFTWNKSTLTAVTLFLFWSLVSIFLSSTKFWDSFYGAWGRNTGWFAYLCLALVFISCTTISNPIGIKRILNAIYWGGAVNIIYFLLTQLGIELIPWNNAYSRILGTFGNPNFVGAFMGFFGVILFSRLISNEITVKQKTIDLFLLLICIIEIKQSLASQGVVVLFGGIAIQLFIWIKINWSKSILNLYSVIVGLISSFALAGALNVGPLASIIYKPSITFRGQYWRAAISAGLDHPVFGLGFDSFGFWYGRYRTPDSIIFPGPETTTNAAHNVYLDILASGGFPLFILYISLNILVLIKAFKIFRNITKFSWVPVSLISVWVCFQTQSLISINQLGIAIWGWVLSGLIISYPLGKTSEKDFNSGSLRVNQSKKRSSKSTNRDFSLTWGFILGLIGFIIGFQPMLADMNWNKALRPINPTVLEKQAKSWPLSYMRLMHASSIYTANGRPDIGLTLAKYTSKEFPDVWMVWDIMLKNPKITEPEKAQVLRQLRRIDPLNPNYQK